MSESCNKKSKSSKKGTVSNVIAWVFIVLQGCLISGGIYNITHDEQSFWQIFSQNLPKCVLVFIQLNVKAIVQLAVFLIGGNLLGIGALILGLIVWLQHKNKDGKITTIAAIVVIIINSLLSVGDNVL